MRTTDKVILKLNELVRTTNEVSQLEPIEDVQTTKHVAFKTERVLKAHREISQHTETSVQRTK